MADLSEFYDGEGAKPEDGDDYEGGEFQPLPTDWYSAEILTEEVKPNKKGNGKYLKLCLEVISEAYNGRKLFPMITLSNPNATAEKIGKGKLGKLTKACGIAILRKSEELLGQRIDVRVVQKPAKGDFPADNDVTDFEPLGTKQGSTPAPKSERSAKPSKPAAPIPPTGESPATAPASAPAKAGGGKMPWEK